MAFKGYVFAIAAYNEEGVGKYSSSFVIWTPEGRPTEPPQSATVSAINSTSVRVTWFPPNAGQLSGHNRGYTVQLERSAYLVRSVDAPHNTVPFDSQQHLVLDHLQKYTEYDITVTCRTSAGAVSFTIAVGVRTLEDGEFSLFVLLACLLVKRLVIGSSFVY